MTQADKFNEDYYIRGIETGLSNYTNYSWLPDLTIPMADLLKSFFSIGVGQTFLDYGCARGYLVKAMRQRQVAAWGYDISKWANENCDPDIAEFLLQTPPPNATYDYYDYLFCKDVLEHIPTDELNELLPKLFYITQEAALFIVPLASRGQYISPDDNKDVTHIQRKSFEEWTDLFKLHGSKFAVLSSTYIPMLKLSAERYPKSTGFFYCKRLYN